jgi:hypothetical protein
MSLGLSNMSTQSNNTLSLGAAAPANTYGGASYNTAYGGASPFTAGILGGAGVSPQQYGAPMAPPSETEILAAMLGTLQPIDRFIISQNMPVFIEMLSNITTFSLLNILKNCTFSLDEEGVLALEVTSLPSDLQTLSAENIIAQLNSLQNTAMQSIQKAENDRAQIKAMADQSLMQGMLGAAMADPGMMENAGQAVGGMFNRALFGRP